MRLLLLVLFINSCVYAFAQNPQAHMIFKIKWNGIAKISIEFTFETLRYQPLEWNRTT